MMKRLKKKIRKLKSSLFYDTEKMMRDIYDFC